MKKYSLKKSIGILRQVDKLGRIVIPKEIRDIFDIKIGSLLDVQANELGEVIIRKIQTLELALQYIDEILNIFAKCSGLSMIFANKTTVLVSTENNFHFKSGDLFDINSLFLDKSTTTKFFHSIIEFTNSTAPYYLIISDSNPIQTSETINYITNLINDKIT